MKITFALPIITATMAVASALPDHVLNARLVVNCKQFQIFRQPDSLADSLLPGTVGTATCCCKNKQCVVHSPEYQITATGVLNDSLGGTFNIVGTSHGFVSGKGALDTGGATYTVSAQGGC